MSIQVKRNQKLSYFPLEVEVLQLHISQLHQPRQEEGHKEQSLHSQGTHPLSDQETELVRMMLACEKQGECPELLEELSAAVM